MTAWREVKREDALSRSATSARGPSPAPPSYSRRSPKSASLFDFLPIDSDSGFYLRIVSNVGGKLSGLSGGSESSDPPAGVAHGAFSKVKREDFKRIERVNGRWINVLQGLELHTGVFTPEEQRKIVDCIFQFQEKGWKGLLRGNFFIFEIKP
ncbi:hypothetical protein Cni_G11654 [Canna indica]|uniref:Uncharacterized protein n=1 Tax=Canna indica TaxID=4628 RepID=A0AAQ3K6S6_9LILI|nr:hypothetical protein Cni_G11654 [Canna indica]